MKKAAANVIPAVIANANLLLAEQLRSSDLELHPLSGSFLMSNHLIKQIQQHGSARNYLPDPVAQDVIEEIVSSASA